MNIIEQAIQESINEFLNENIVDKFTPYTPEQAKINKMGIGRMGNPSYDKANKAYTTANTVKYHSYNDWYENYKPKGVTWAEYQKMEI